jgi:vacuolar-type H+-ATPase subunit H
MDNTLCKQILVHAGFSIENWGIPGTPEFAENKALYNQWYYSTHKDQWVDYNNPDKQRENVKSELERQIEDGVQNLTNQAIGSAQQAATNYLETHKEEIARKAVDSLEVVGQSAMSVGKEILNEMKRRAKDYWNIGVDTIVNKAKKAKSDFQSSFNSGMDSIISGVKSFASLWKSGW